MIVQELPQLEGWTLYRAEPALVEASLEARLEGEPNDLHFVLEIDKRLVERAGDEQLVRVIGFYTKYQPDGTESSIICFRSARPFTLEQIVKLRGDLFGLERLGAAPKSMMNIALTRDLEGGVIVCTELFLIQPAGRYDIWVLSSSVHSFESSFEQFRMNLAQDSACWLTDIGAKVDTTVSWHFGTSSINLAKLGVDFVIGHEASLSAVLPKRVVSLSSRLARIEIFRSADPSRFRLVRQLSGSAEAEFATLSAGPSAASFVCSCLEPVQVSRGSSTELPRGEVEGGTPLARFELVVYRGDEGDDERTYSVGVDGIRLKYFKDGESVETVVNPVDMYIDLLRCLAVD